MDHVTSQDGTAIAFDRSGTGPALILVGGAFQYRSFDPRTARLAELLATDFTVYHYDRRGRGDSTDTLPYAPQREIEDIAALITEAGGSAHVFGMSSGAILALDAAAHGLPMIRLAVYEPPAIVDDTRPAIPDDYLDRLNGLLAAGRRGDAVELFLTEAVGVPAEYVAPMRGEPMWPGFEAVAHTLAYDGAIVAGTQEGRPLPATRWAAVSSPVLVIDGGASPPWLRNGAQAVADALPDAQRSTLDGQTHEVSPEVLAPALSTFFAG
jgi:pimeloyl-ACP methyl ester carboxylesterase